MSPHDSFKAMASKSGSVLQSNPSSPDSTPHVNSKGFKEGTSSGALKKGKETNILRDKELQRYPCDHNLTAGAFGYYSEEDTLLPVYENWKYRTEMQLLTFILGPKNLDVPTLISHVSTTPKLEKIPPTNLNTEVWSFVGKRDTYTDSRELIVHFKEQVKELSNKIDESHQILLRWMEDFSSRIFSPIENTVNNGDLIYDSTTFKVYPLSTSSFFDNIDFFRSPI